MPQLENSRHEAFAGALARGMKQAAAYAHAGYSPNPPAASRLANSPALKARVEEIKKEVHQAIVKTMDEPNEENFGTLKEMGLTMEWVASAFKNIHDQAVAAGKYGDANTAVKNIQTMIEIENNGKTEKDNDDRPKVDLRDVTAMFKEMRGVIDAAKKETPPEMVDITPETEDDNA